VLADRVAPARIVVAATWLRTAALAGLAVLVVLGPPPTVVIAVLAGVLGVLDAAYYPASLAPLPKVVAPAGLARANALVQGAESAGDLFGQAAAAAIVAVAGLGGGLSTVACLYLLAAIVLAAFTRRLMRTRPTTRSTGSLAATGTVGASPGLLATVHVEPAHTPTTTPMAALREGLRFAWGEPVVRTIPAGARRVERRGDRPGAGRRRGAR